MNEERAERIYNQMRPCVVVPFSEPGTVKERKLGRISRETINRLLAADELPSLSVEDIGTSFNWENGRTYTIVGYLPNMVSDDRKSYLPEIVCRCEQTGAYFLFWMTGIERARKVTAGNGSWEVSWEDYEAFQIDQMSTSLHVLSLTDPIARQAIDAFHDANP